MRNFYCDENKTTYDFTGILLERWNALRKSFDNGRKEYDRLEFKKVSGKTVISGPPLFCRNCEKGTRNCDSTERTRKFSFVMVKVLLPFALEFHLKSRTKEMSKTATQEVSQLNSVTPNLVQLSLRKIAGNLRKRQAEFHNYLKKQGKPYTATKVRRSLEYINKVRLQRIINLLEFVEDQGWEDGSAMGSLDHEMNRNGAGYMHTLFLLKDSLHQDPNNKTRLIKLINTAKWYNDFGEIYETPFEYKGTTSDRMITIILFRLMIVLVMPTDTEDERKARQRDMDALKNWMENALDINTAFGGVIKPDYTGFHHNAIYASAYAPYAGPSTISVSTNGVCTFRQFKTQLTRSS